MRKKLLILGAGIYQVPLIKKAKEMGLYTIAASYAGNYPGFAVADEIWEIDTTNYQELLKRAKDADISGVCTTGTDVSVISVGYLCDQLHLCGIPFPSAKLATDKASMKEAFLNAGVSTPFAVKVFSLDEALQAFHKIGAPAIVKAVDSSGSRGINRVDSEEALVKAYHSAMEVTHREYILVEQFLTAHEIGVDGLISNGKIQLLLPHDKFTLTSSTTTLPEGHRFPYPCSEKLYQSILKETTNAIHALGLNDCAFNADVLVSDETAYILEMGGRAGATCIPELISIYTGLDYYELMIRMALCETLTLSNKLLQKNPCMAKLLFSPVAGVLDAIDNRSLNELSSDRISISLDFVSGSSIEAVTNGTCRFGQVIFLSDSLSEMESLMSEVQHAITINGERLDDLWNN